MRFDVIVIGAGAAGMMCAGQAGGRGRRVLLIDHMAKLGERIRISGGGRCNFTNRSVSAENYLSQNPHFCRGALSRFSPQDFLAMVERRRIPYHEREHGQLFCDDSAKDIIGLLKAGCDETGVEWALATRVLSIERSQDENGMRFCVSSDRGRFHARSLVIASGGLAAPKIGASPFGYQVARQFGLSVIPPKPALVPLALAPETLAPLEPLSGSALAAATKLPIGLPGNQPEFRDQVLITHRGLSGPAILQISSYWQMQEYAGGKKPIAIDLLPGISVESWLKEAQQSKMLLPNLLALQLPRRFAQEWCALQGWQERPAGEFSRRELEALVHALKNWSLMPSGTLGYAKAEVTLGGVSTEDLSSKTMEARSAAGLYFIGEVVDVTGWLGGYNFQWAWSSGWVAGQFA
jgi:predicted Rossmann fold flavoprotein